jgi:hypothetical protein
MKYKAKNNFAMRTLVLIFFVCVSQVNSTENYLKPRDEKVKMILKTLS